MSEPLVRDLGFPSFRLAGHPLRSPYFDAAARFRMRRIAVWFNRRRQRRALATLSDHLLDDIGVSRGEALHEAAKPFWR